MADKPPTAEEVQSQFGWARFLLHAFLAVPTAPYRRTFKLYTWRPLKEFRRAGTDRRVLIPMVRDWKNDKYAELQSVQVAASFCAGATLATITWTKIANPIWVADALWFCALVCSIWAVITSIQTKSILDDLPNRDQLTSALPDSEFKRMRRVILRYKKTPGVGHWVMAFIWQFPSMTMSYAWCTFLSGLSVYVCTPFIRQRPWGDNHKIAIVYLTVGSVGFFTYLFSSVFVYTSEKAYLLSTANTRVNTDESESSMGTTYAGGGTNFAVDTAYVDQQPQTPGRGGRGQQHRATNSTASDPVQAARAKALWNIKDNDSRHGSVRSRQLLI